MPVGFKYFSQLLFDGVIGIGGEESAGASFLKKDGTVWTTDKDGIIMALLSMEIMAVMGKSALKWQMILLRTMGNHASVVSMHRVKKEQKQILKQLSAELITATSVDGDPITGIRTTSMYNNMPIDGVRVETDKGMVCGKDLQVRKIYTKFMVKAIKAI